MWLEPRARSRWSSRVSAREPHPEPGRRRSLELPFPPWHAEDAGGLNSMAWYDEWLRTGDVELREKLLRYNLDDVLAMEVIDHELRRITDDELACEGAARMDELKRISA